MEHWPDDVIERYSALAACHGWSEQTRDAFFAWIDARRRAELSSSPRRYLHVGSELDGREYFYECVDAQGELIAVRQVVIDDRGNSHRYSWHMCEDDFGRLTDQPFSGNEISADDADDFVVNASSQAAFEDAWGSINGAAPEPTRA